MKEPLTVEQKVEIRHLWERTPMTAKEIGLKFGVSSSTIIGMAHRRGWTSFNPGHESASSKTTTADRLDALHNSMDQLLKRCGKFRPQPLALTLHKSKQPTR